MILRWGDYVRVEALSPAEAAFIEGLRLGKTLAEATEEALATGDFALEQALAKRAGAGAILTAVA